MKTLNKVFLGVSGILLVALGIICICNPVGTLFAGAWIIGLLTLVAGIFNLIFTLRTQHFMFNSGTRMLLSLLEIFLGIIVLSHKSFITAILPFIFSLWIFVEGLSMAIESFDFKKVHYSYWWMFLALGIAGAIFGVIGIFNPLAAGTTLSTLFGVGIVVIGLAYLLALTGVRKFENFVNTARMSERGDIDEQ